MKRRAFLYMKKGAFLELLRCYSKLNEWESPVKLFWGRALGMSVFLFCAVGASRVLEIITARLYRSGQGLYLHIFFHTTWV